MHAYRDAILGSRGAYVLYPSAETEPALFVRSRDPGYRATHTLPSVGAFPLRGLAYQEQENQLRVFVAGAIAALGRLEQPHW